MEAEDSVRGGGRQWYFVKPLPHGLPLGLHPWYEFPALPFMERTVHLLYLAHPSLFSWKPCPASGEALRCTFFAHVKELLGR